MLNWLTDIKYKIGFMKINFPYTTYNTTPLDKDFSLNKNRTSEHESHLSCQVGATGQRSNLFMAKKIRIDSFHEKSAQKLPAMK